MIEVPNPTTWCVYEMSDEHTSERCYSCAGTKRAMYASVKWCIETVEAEKVGLITTPDPAAYGSALEFILDALRVGLETLASDEKTWWEPLEPTS